MPVTIYHNPRCSKSRATLQLIEEAGFKPRVVAYMTSPPSQSELSELLSKLGMRPSELVRRGEEAFRTQNLAQASEEELLAAMSHDPRLIQRPIVVRGAKARLGRPPEDVLELLE